MQSDYLHQTQNKLNNVDIFNSAAAGAETRTDVALRKFTRLDDSLKIEMFPQRMTERRAFSARFHFVIFEGSKIAKG